MFYIYRLTTGCGAFFAWSDYEAQERVRGIEGLIELYREAELGGDKVLVLTIE